MKFHNKRDLREHTRRSHSKKELDRGEPLKVDIPPEVDKYMELQTSNQMFDIKDPFTAGGKDDVFNWTCLICSATWKGDDETGKDAKVILVICVSF